MSENKTILILGAGPDQLPIYKAAQARGLRIIGADARPKAVSRPLSDRFLHISSVAGADVELLLGDERVDGAVSPGNDSFHHTIAHLNGRYDLPNPLSQAAIQASCDKAYFCEEVNKLGLCAPQGKSSDDIDLLQSYAAQLGYPLVVKPIDSSGNKGVTCVVDAAELDAALTNAFAVSPSKRVLVERYIEGAHGGIEVFRIDGEVQLMAVSQRHHSGPPDFLTLKHVVGLPWPPQLAQKLKTAVNHICDHFGIMTGPVNFDFIIQDGEIVFLEMGARLSGNGFPYLVRYCYDWNTYDLALQVALGELNDGSQLPPQTNNVGAILIIKAMETGTLHAYHNIERIRQHPAFVEEHLFVQPGQSVTKFSQANHRLGYFMVVSPNVAEINDIIHIFDEEFTVQVCKD